MQGRTYRGLAAVVFVALALAACNFSVSFVNPSGTTPTASGTAVPRFEKGAACPFDLGGQASGFALGKNVTCGFLVVRADRSSATSPTLRLAVAIFKTPSVTPAPDPIIFLQGGPGGRVLQDFAPLVIQHQIDLVTQFGNHDLIMIDQRGTGYSQPSLQCSEVVALQLETDLNVTPTQAVALQNKAIADCHKRLVSQGIDLNDYTTLSDAADIHDLITTLGYAQVDLYSVSYGTRLALEMMRSFPQHIRSVILDSTVPAQVKLLTSVPGSTARVFDTLFQGCAADVICNTRYPQLDTVFYSLVAALNASPVTFQTRNPDNGKTYTVLFHGDDLVNLVFLGFYATPAIPLLPELIYQVQHGDYTHRLAQFYGIFILSGADAVSWGMYYSVECAEDVDFLTTQDVAAAGQAYPPQIRTDQVISLEGEIGGCQSWNVKKADPSEANPVTSAIPTIVLEAEYDPITPPTNGELAARTLSHSYTFLFPASGHGAFLFNDCPTKIVLAFESNPNQKPDATCIAAMGEPQFE
jgi:pimeloyl-ACP methyl ester carboxylesterase